MDTTAQERLLKVIDSELFTEEMRLRKIENRVYGLRDRRIDILTEMNRLENEEEEPDEVFADGVPVSMLVKENE